MLKGKIKNIAFKKKSLYELVCNLFVLLYFMFLYAFFEYRVFMASILFFFLLYYFITRRKNLTLFSLWNLVLILWFASSYVWSYNPEQTLVEVRILIEIAIFSNLFIAFIDRPFKLVLFYKIIVIAGFVFVLRLLYEFPISYWLSQRLGSEEFNANQIGMYLSFSAIFSLFIARFNKKIIYYILFIIFSFVVFLTGSRKAFVLLIMGSALLIYFNEGRNLTRKLLAIPIVVVLVTFGYYLVINVPTFYEILGSRIESALSAVSGVGNVDSSTQTRLLMIETGKQLFYDNPILGYGIGSYSVLSGFFTYSHNNYIELLVGTGIVGLLIYYSMLISILFKLYNKRKHFISNPLLVIIFMFLIMDYGLVSYNGFVYQFLIALGFAATRVVGESQLQNYNY